MAIEGLTQEKNHDIDFRWVLVGKKLTFISVINRIIFWGGIYIWKGIFGILEISLYLDF